MQAMWAIPVSSPPWRRSLPSLPFAATSIRTVPAPHCRQQRPSSSSGKLFYLVHSIHDLDIDPVAAGVAVVVSGHSHKPGIELRSGVMYLNPGSAGPRRFKLPISLALVTLNDAVEATIVELSA